MRVVIVDDEELARARLRRLLGAHPDVEVIADLADATEAEARLAELAPDVALLDVRMPQRDGFAVAAALGARPCVVVFVTAWADHAVQAFDAGAADFLLKPVDAERLAVALKRARDRLRGALPPRLAVRDGSRFVFVDLADVDGVVAQGNYVELRAHGRAYTVRATLAALEARLDPAAFVRVHRSVLLRVARITAIEPVFRGEYLITLADGTTFTSARSHRAELRRVLGLP